MSTTSEPDPARAAAIARGRETVERIYGFPADWALTPLSERTLGDLFGEVWNRPELAVRDRRLLVLGIVAHMGRGDLIGLQVYGALRNEELTVQAAAELPLHLAYYVGWPTASVIQEAVDGAIARYEAETAASPSDGEEPAV